MRRTPTSLRLSGLLTALWVMLIPMHMDAQKDKWIGEPVLHGYYEPLGHPGRTYMFRNNGEFTSLDHPSCLEARMYGHGTYELNGKTLTLHFAPARREPGDEHERPEEPHVEVHRISLKGNESYEISEFRIKTKEKPRARLVWRRKPGHLDHELKKTPGTAQE